MTAPGENCCDAAGDWLRASDGSVLVMVKLRLTVVTYASGSWDSSPWGANPVTISGGNTVTCPTKALPVLPVKTYVTLDTPTGGVGSGHVVSSTAETLVLDGPLTNGVYTDQLYIGWIDTGTVTSTSQAYLTDALDGWDGDNPYIELDFLGPVPGSDMPMFPSISYGPNLSGPGQAGILLLGTVCTIDGLSNTMAYSPGILLGYCLTLLGLGGYGITISYP